LFNVDVSVGVVPAVHLNETGHATVLAVPSATNCKEKEWTPGEAGTFCSVNVVIAAFKLT
jgi:hypothetical protein